MTDSSISRVFGTHAQARQAADALEHAGVGRGQVSVVDRHGNGDGGTVLTVAVTPDRAASVEAVLAQYPTVPGAGPLVGGTIPLGDVAPAYVAGGTANLGTPGPD